MDSVGIALITMNFELLGHYRTIDHGTTAWTIQTVYLLYCLNIGGYLHMHTVDHLIDLV